LLTRSLAPQGYERFMSKYDDCCFENRTGKEASDENRAKEYGEYSQCVPASWFRSSLARPIHLTLLQVGRRRGRR
jgi:hypothetical protein